MKRRIVFPLILTFGLIVDMVSTHFMMLSGYKEGTGLVFMIWDTHPLLLYTYALTWGLIMYWVYPKLDNLKITTHFETICIWYSIISTLAGIGNFYLYYRFGGM